MPDKIYKRGCGGTCLRCWRNKLKHASPETKKYMKKNSIISVDGANACNEVFDEIEAEIVERKQKFFRRYEELAKIKVNTR